MKNNFSLRYKYILALIIDTYYRQSISVSFISYSVQFIFCWSLYIYIYIPLLFPCLLWDHRPLGPWHHQHGVHKAWTRHFTSKYPFHNRAIDLSKRLLHLIYHVSIINCISNLFSPNFIIQHPIHPMYTKYQYRISGPSWSPKAVIGIGKAYKVISALISHLTSTGIPLWRKDGRNIGLSPQWDFLYL